MALLTQTFKKSKSRSNKAYLKSATMKNDLETMDIGGIIYFPCRICNRLFKDEKLAIGHLQKCKPRIYLLANEELTKKRSGDECRDPYEIIPEEMDLEDQIVNNNSTDHNRNSSGNGKSTKRPRRCNKSNESRTSPRSNHRVPDTKVANIKDSSSRSKQNGLQLPQSNIETQKVLDKDVKMLKQMNLVEGITSKKCVTKGKQRKTRRGLTDEEIEDRLRKISGRLKKHKQIELGNEDEEEDQRRAIEEKLSYLNQDSEVCPFDNDDETEDRWKDEEDSCKSVENAGSKSNKPEMVDCMSQKVDCIADEDQDCSIPDPLSNTLMTGKETSDSLVKFEGNSALNSGISYDMVVTQCPDGQLHDCKKCSEVFVSEMELLRHTRSKHTYPRIRMAPNLVEKFLEVEDRSQCPICKKPLSSMYKSIYIKHLQTHSCVADYECPVCRKKFRRKDHMKAHEKRHII